MKSKGLIPQHWDLRRLTTGQKSWVTKQSQKYASVVAKPKNFESRTYSAAKAKQLKGAGYFGEGNKILIPNFGEKSAKTKVNKNSITITRYDSRGRSVTEKIYLHSNQQLLNALQKEFSKDLGPGEYWSLKVGDNNTFLNAGEKNLPDLMRYGSRVVFKGNGEQVEWAQSHVHLVKFKFDDGEDHLRMNQLPYNPSNPADPSNFKGVYKPRKKKWANKRGK